jgi:hypothetical protein
MQNMFVPVSELVALKRPFACNFEFVQSICSTGSSIVIEGIELVGGFGRIERPNWVQNQISDGHAMDSILSSQTRFQFTRNTDSNNAQSHQKCWSKTFPTEMHKPQDET